MTKNTALLDEGYFKRSTVMIISVVCLVIGFAAGMIFSNLSNDMGEVRHTVENVPSVPSTPAPSSTPAPGPSPVGPSLEKIQALKDLVAANPKDAEAWSQLGHLYFDTDQFQPAIDAYKKHLELNPNNANVWTDMGVMYRRMKQPDEALRCFDKAIEVNPKHEQSRFNKGIVLMFDKKNQGEAIKTWEALLKLNPNAKAPNGQPLGELIKQYGPQPVK